MYVISEQNDNIDAICYRTLGRTDILPQVIADNSHTLHMPILPAGIRILLKTFTSTTPAEKINLWN